MCSYCDGRREEPIRGSRRGPGARLIRFAKMAVNVEVIITSMHHKNNKIHFTSTHPYRNNCELLVKAIALQLIILL